MYIFISEYISYMYEENTGQSDFAIIDSKTNIVLNVSTDFSKKEVIFINDIETTENQLENFEIKFHKFFKSSISKAYELSKKNQRSIVKPQPRYSVNIFSAIKKKLNNKIYAGIIINPQGSNSIFYNPDKKDDDTIEFLPESLTRDDLKNYILLKIGLK